MSQASASLRVGTHEHVEAPEVFTFSLPRTGGFRCPLGHVPWRAAFLGVLVMLGAPQVGAATPARVAHIVPDVDDDDRDGVVDWTRPDPADPDLAHIALGLRPGDELLLQGDIGSVRVWQRGVHILGGLRGASWRSIEARSTSVAVQLADFSVQARLTRLRVGSPDLVWVLKSAPVVLPHSFRPVERGWVSRLQADPDGGSNAALLGVLVAALGPRLRSIDPDEYGDDRWPQDQFEIAWAVGDTGRVRVVLESLRDGFYGVGGEFVPDVLGWGPDTTSLLLGGDDWTDLDSFGNLEVTPPLPGHPEGRVYYGRNAEDAPAVEVTRFLTRQGVQAPFALETGWLCVGHVDEIVSFVPDPTAPRGFRVLLPSPRLAYALLHLSPGATSIDAYREPPTVDPSYRTVGELRGDASLRAYNEALSAGPLRRLRAQLDEAIGLMPHEVIHLPALYAPYDQPDAPACGAVSLLPNLLNGLLLPEKGGATLLLPDPRMRPDGAPPESDLFIKAVRLLLPASTKPVFVDVWDAYHRHLGSIHCATNMQRAASAPPTVVFPRPFPAPPR